MSYISINRNTSRCAKIVNSAELDTDLDGGTLPQYSFYTPDLDNDAHEYATVVVVVVVVVVVAVVVVGVVGVVVVVVVFFFLF
jgi:hypothetical protein